MKRFWKWIRENPNRSMFLVPIILVAAISISHVVTWYDMANPINWAIYLSVAIEIAAMTALVAASTKVRGGVWFMFGLVTLIQVIGNVFYCYKEIDANGELFKSWVELTSPIWELVGTETTDVISLKRWLAFLEGGLLPIISLTSLHFFITYKKEKTENNDYFNNRNEHLENIVDGNIKKKESEPEPVEKEIIKPEPEPVEKEIIKPEPEPEDDFELVLSVPEGKEFNTPYPINMEIEENEIEEKSPLNSDNEELSKTVIEEVLEETTTEEEIVVDDDYDSEGNLNFTPSAIEPPVEEESKAQSVKATTPATSGIVKKTLGDKKRID